MEVETDSGNKPLVYLKNSKQKRQLPAKGYWRAKNSHYYAESHGTIMPMQCYACPEEGQCFF
ncbi:hypothetical protein DW886_23120 [Enterocloster aldenensis]|nr:hypothetical protein DW886_23120 [Enterocloster aldenensis]